MSQTSPRPLLLCLHGWGGSGESFTELREALKGTDIEILTPDLPGFGKEPEPDRPWNVDDYADWVVEKFQKATANRQVLLLGHSHGGRIAIALASRLGQLSTDRPEPGRRVNSQLSILPIAHLYLCAAAGIRRPRHFKRILGLTLAKMGKALLSLPGVRALQPIGKKLLYRLVRVHDYEQASPVMRQTMIRVTAQDLRPLLKNISIPTDIFWGKDDGMTPFEDGKIIHKEIRGSRLHAYAGVRHRVHRDRAGEVARIIVFGLGHA